MSTFWHHAGLSLPLFMLVLVGYLLARIGNWSSEVSAALTRFVFSVAMPAMLFHMMSDLSRLPPVDTRLLAAFFGSCLLVFIAGRLIAWRVFGLDGKGQSVFALGGVFSQNVMLGVPLTKSILGDAALPAVGLVLVFNSLVLWTLVTVSVEWARHGAFSLRGFGKTALSVVANPLVAAILGGSLFGLSGLALPALVEKPLAMAAQGAVPLILIVLGMGLAEYGIRKGWQQSVVICALKLGLQPVVAWLLARAFDLPPMETQVVVLLSSLAVGTNVYLMARQFNTLEGPIATSMTLSTALSALTTPLALTLAGS